MTKVEIIKNIHDKLDLTKRESSKIVESLFGIIKGNLARGSELKISGFGNFCIREKKSRKGRNPKTGEEIEICRRRVLTFKASHVLREALNGKKASLK